MMTLCSNGIGMVEVSAFGRKILDKQFYPFDSIDDDGEILNELLNKILAKHSTDKTQQLEVILASNFVRFLVLPKQSVYLNANEKLAFANALYQDVYGALAEQWLLVLDDTPPYQPTLCAAIDQKLLDQLKQVATLHRFSLTSVLPHIISVINHLNLRNYQGCLAVVESSRLVFVEFNYVLNYIQQVKWQDNWITPLQKILKKTQLSSRLVKNQLMIYGPTHQDLDSSLFDQWDVTLYKSKVSTLGDAEHFQMITGRL